VLAVDRPHLRNSDLASHLAKLAFFFSNRHNQSMSSSKKYALHLATIWWPAVVMACSWLAYCELQRIEDGALFAFSLPHELPPTEVEIVDAKQSATAYQYIATAAVALLGWAAPSILRWASPGTVRAVPKSILIVFAIAVLSDLATTIRFFHTHGIEYELHPGIRLFGYAYGRTMGALIGKSIQAAGVLIMARVFGGYGALLVVLVSLTYILAAIYNLCVAL
jgi:hypothetical protein